MKNLSDAKLTDKTFRKKDMYFNVFLFPHPTLEILPGIVRIERHDMPVFQCNLFGFHPRHGTQLHTKPHHPPQRLTL